MLTDIAQNPGKVWPCFDRAKLTISADDCDYIPKVPDAGKIFQDGSIRYQLMHNGIKILEDSYYGSWMTEVIYGLRGHHEPQEEKVFHEVLKYMPSNATMIELGSYWGYYSLWFSKMVDNAKNFLIEPVYANLELGKVHFALNNMKADFTLGYIPSYYNYIESDSNRRKILIDDFIKERQIEHVNILHADIQGGEYEMLLNCKEAIENEKIDYFFISTHGGDLHSQCREFFIKANYLIIADHTMQESCSCDGLIVARRKNIEGPNSIPIKKYPNNLFFKTLPPHQLRGGCLFPHL